MKSSHKTNKDLCFIMQQLTLDKLFKYDCGGRAKKHGFGSLQKWQIWPNFTIEKTQSVRGISTWNKHCFKSHCLLFLVLKNIWRHSIRAPSRDQNLKGILTPRDRASSWNKQVTTLRKNSLLENIVSSTFEPFSEF